MGTWSYICKGGCGKPICEGEDVVGISNAVYEGYGRVGHDESEQAIYHRACFAQMVVDRWAGLLNFEPGEHDPDQGCGYPDARFVPQDTVLYDPAFAPLEGAAKVGLAFDLSGSSPLIAADPDYGMRPAVDKITQALHYLGPREVELIQFSDVVERETLPGDGEELYRILVFEPAREGYRFGGAFGGGDGVVGALAAAKEAGCDAVVLVSDGAHASWPEEFDLPVVHMQLVDDERDIGREPPEVPAWVAARLMSPYHIPLTDEERDEIERKVNSGELP